MMHFKNNFKLFGEKVIIVDINKYINNPVSLAWRSELCVSLQNEFQNILNDVVFTLSEITIFLKITPEKFHLQQIHKFIINFSLNKKNIIRTLWEVTACFDQIYCENILINNKKKLISHQCYISEFLNCNFEVHHYGFLPGFIYLSGLPSKLHLSRKATPEKNILPGTISVGESYVGVYPQNSPGGWNRIGRTNHSFFNKKSTPPCFVLPGDKIKFTSIDIDEYQREMNNINTKILKSQQFEIVF